MTSPVPIQTAGNRKPRRGLKRQVREILSAGGLVALPTETVYGIAARADDPAALDALEALKGGGDPSATRPFTWHVADLDALDAFDAPEGPRCLMPLARRLADRFWPGPLTLVLRGVPKGLEGAAQDGWTGLRLPAHATTRGLIEALDFPVVATSANRAGGEPLTSAAEVSEAFGGEVELVVDGGSCRLAESSTVLALGPGRFEILREGILDADALRKAVGLSLAFVCAGNTCRSPIAESLARMRLAERLGLTGNGEEDLATFGFHIASAGVLASFGSAPSPNGLKILDELGAPHPTGGSSLARAEDMAAHDHVFCMTRDQLEALRLLLPPRAGTHLELLDPEGGDISDPIGGSVDVYRTCAERIDASIKARLDDWA
jgi:tRNA threonylcarbamoyl adenosine modification protein (Sua5/YciO/YrdC/YwlC family)